jgi:hypothetical protein
VQDKIRKQERLMFAKAVNQADFEIYLESCDLCEEKTAAEMRISEFEKKRHHEISNDSEKQQEHQQFLDADSPEKLKSYLRNCVYCLDKNNVAQKRKELAKLAEARAEEKPPMPKTGAAQSIEKVSQAAEKTLPEVVTNWIWEGAKHALIDLLEGDKNKEEKKP